MKKPSRADIEPHSVRRISSVCVAEFDTSPANREALDSQRFSSRGGTRAAVLPCGEPLRPTRYTVQETKRWADRSSTPR